MVVLKVPRFILSPDIDNPQGSAGKDTGTISPIMILEFVCLWSLWAQMLRYMANK
jgi:hypothetical protein